MGGSREVARGWAPAGSPGGIELGELEVGTGVSTKDLPGAEGGAGGVAADPDDGFGPRLGTLREEDVVTGVDGGRLAEEWAFEALAPS